METKIDPSQKRVKLTVRVDGIAQTFEVRPGLGLEAISLKHNLPLEFDCRKADCGICSFVCHGDGLSPKSSKEEEYLLALAAQSNERLACQTRIFSDSEIEIATDW